tara:strand:+ start:16412 stop:17977 length:1566 start_codon:yes stop_codon:yes gene_type:complete
MPAVVTDQFRIFNANNFIDSLLDSSNNYYVFLGLVNPSPATIGFGRTDNSNWPTNPIDNLQFRSHNRDTALFGKKITAANVRRVIRKISWVRNTKYDMYRHDYSSLNPSPNTQVFNLYDSNYYVINSDFRVYICIDNGSSGGQGTETAKGENSLDEPTHTDLEPQGGTSGDGYLWKYLFTISPSDIIKFDSTEFIVLPNDWPTSSDSSIQDVREAADSRVNNNQIKKVYVENSGSSSSRTYQEGTKTLNILGDGTGGKVSVTVNSNGKITDAVVSEGGQGYTYGIVDLKPIQATTTINEIDRAKLIPIIPPSRGHGFDLYSELGADKVLVYARFDDSSPDFPTDTKFAQVGIIKNPEQFSNDSLFTGNTFSSTHALKLVSNPNTTPTIGVEITQSTSEGTARGYLISYDSTTNVVKFSRDRSLYFSNNQDQTDNSDVNTISKIVNFEAGSTVNPLSVSVDNFSGITSTVNSKVIDLGVNFVNGVADPEINKKTGELIYIDNRSLVSRDPRQKEDIKIILEF